MPNDFNAKKTAQLRKIWAEAEVKCEEVSYIEGRVSMRVFTQEDSDFVVAALINSGFVNVTSRFRPANPGYGENRYLINAKVA